MWYEFKQSKFWKVYEAGNIGQIEDEYELCEFYIWELYEKCENFLFENGGETLILLTCDSRPLSTATC